MNDTPQVVVNERCRLDLLRMLAALRDFEIDTGKDKDPCWPRRVPLFAATTEADRGYPDEWCLLAARESERLGHIEGNATRDGDFYMKITDAGYAFIKAHDAIGEAEQEVSRQRPLS